VSTKNLSPQAENILIRWQTRIKRKVLEKMSETMYSLENGKMGVLSVSCLFLFLSFSFMVHPDASNEMRPENIRLCQ